MKTKKWLNITLVSILTLIIVAGVGAAGYRVGLTQNPQVIQNLADLRAQRLTQMKDQTGRQAAPQGKDSTLPQNPNDKTTNPQGQEIAPQQNPNNGMYNPHAQGFDPRSNSAYGFDPRARSDRRDSDRRDGFASPLFGLIHLIILGALIWFVYKYIKNSGWKLVREVQSAPVVSAAASVEEKKDEA